MTVTYRSDERLTPELLQSVSFPAARFGRRGFDEEQVRAFLVRVERELVTLLNERTSLREEVERLRQRVLSEGGGGYRPEDAHIQAVNVLSSAQQTADRYVADAQEYSRQLAEDARRRRDEVIAEARAIADRVLEEAHDTARSAAMAVMTGPEGQSGDRQHMEAEMAYLRTFSDVYRTHLRAYLEALLRNVDEWERAERSALDAARAQLPGQPRGISPI
jgi:DivIVA domain-containing protein